MKTSRTPDSRSRRTFTQHVRATFGDMDGRRLRNRSFLALGLASLLMTGAASADWSVYDRRVEDVLERILSSIGEEESVNQRLEDLNTKLQIDQGANGETPEIIPEPTGDEGLDATNPTAAAGVDIAGRCSTDMQTAMPQQYTVCQETVRTELAMYRFSMRMFERAQENYDRLRRIEEQRRSMGGNDLADLQDNSNKLLALTALMDNDRDRYRTYMSAYDARMVYLQKASDLLSKQAISGGSSTGGMSDILPGLLGAGVLAIALREAAATDENSCTDRMRRAGVC